jgi:hypothetical protein
MSGTITTNPFSPVSGKSTPVVLVVSPSLNAEGRKAYNTRGQLFDGRVGDRFLVKRSTTPFCSAARVLLAEGADSAARFVMRHEGSPHDALLSTVGAAAKLAVADDSVGKPVFVPWVDLRQTWSSAARSGPPMRATDPALVPVPAAPGRVLEDLSQQFAEDELLRAIEGDLASNLHPGNPSPAAEGVREPTTG